MSSFENKKYALITYAKWLGLTTSVREAISKFGILLAKEALSNEAAQSAWGLMCLE